MSTPTHPILSRDGARAAVPAIVLICAVVLLSGCLPVPATQPPAVITVLVEVTRVVPETAAPAGTTVATSRPEVPSTVPRAAGTPGVEPSTLGAPSPSAPEPPGPDTAAPMGMAPPTVDSSEQTNPPFLAIMLCEPSDSPDVFAMGTPQMAAVELPPVCITGFPPNTEVALSVTYPDGQSEVFTELMDEFGTAMVGWSAETAFPMGTYTLSVTQGDLSATSSVEVGPGAGPQEPTPEPQVGEPSVEVKPVGDSGRDFEVVLSGFEPYQEVRLRLYVATDDTRTEFDEIDSLSQQVDAQGEATFPLEVTPGHYPSSWYALSYFLEDGSAVYDEFQVE